MKMLKESNGNQLKYEFVTIENLVPENHLLRKIDKVIDFSFINEICKPYYCLNNGRPAIEPETLFKMLFIGYLYGIRSERRLVEEVKVNVSWLLLGELFYILLQKKNSVKLQNNLEIKYYSKKDRF